MPRRTGGFIGHRGLQAPDPPTAVTPTAGNAQVSVAFTAPSDVGDDAITGFVAQVSTNGTDYSAGSNTGSSSPIVLSSLTGGTAYTAKVWAINDYGTSAPSDASSSATPINPSSNTGLFMGGAGDAGNEISLLNISTLSNSIDYGDIANSKEQCSCTGNATHAFRLGGNGPTTDIYRVAYSSGGDATDYANLATATRLHGGFGNNTRSFVLGGYTTSAGVNTIQTFLYSSTGDATDFGDMGNATYYVTGCSNSTKGLYSRPTSNNRSNVVETITLGSSGTGSDFGDLSSSRFRILCTASSTRALFGGGDTSSGDVNTIDYFTIASAGNATDFGDLTVARNRGPAAATATRGVFCGGYAASGSPQNNPTIDYVTFASTGNAIDFGDMSENHYEMTGGASSSSAAVS
jgi:hypothetical protein